MTGAGESRRPMRPFNTVQWGGVALVAAGIAAGIAAAAFPAVAEDGGIRAGAVRVHVAARSLGRERLDILGGRLTQPVPLVTGHADRCARRRAPRRTSRQVTS